MYVCTHVNLYMMSCGPNLRITAPSGWRPLVRRTVGIHVDPTIHSVTRVPDAPNVSTKVCQEHLVATENTTRQAPAYIPRCCQSYRIGVTSRSEGLFASSLHVIDTFALELDHTKGNGC